MTTGKVAGTGKKVRQAGKSDVEVVQAAPTAARPTDANGREIDQWGLPINGPARAAALAELGLPDPDQEPQAWLSDDATTGDVTAGSVAEPSKIQTAENGNG